MEKSIFGFIWRYSKREQIIVLLVTLASFPFLYLSLEVPKIIVNEALSGTDFPRLILGVELGQIPYLLMLCCLFLLLVLTNGVFKMRINIYKGTIAERMMRRLRYVLVSRILRFPPEHFRRVSQGDLIPMVTAEVEPLGGLMGDAVASPVFLGGQMLTIMLFLFVQDPLLGIASVALIPLQAYVIPILQRQVNLLHREKVKRVRALSNQIGETVAGVQDISVNDVSAYTLARYSKHLGVIYRIRLAAYNKKFFMKFLNNMMNQITPFFFYSVGGYLVIVGDLTIGALVAALGAYKDLTSPWRDLLGFYNQVQDSSIRYETVVEQFAPSGLRSDSSEPGTDIAHLTGPVEVTNVSWEDEDGVRALSNVSFTVPPGRSIAIVGADETGGNRLAQLLNRSLEPVSGRIRVGAEDLRSLPAAVSGLRIGYVGPESYLFSGTVLDNVQLALNRKPPTLTDATPSQLREIEEAHASGNSPHPADASWVDYGAAGYDDQEAFVAWWLEVVRTLGSEEALVEHRLGGRLDVDRRPDLAARLLEARRTFGERIAREEYRDLVHRFDPERYNPCASVAQNILFGTAASEALAPENLGTHPHMLTALDACGLRETMARLSLKVADAILEMFSDVAPGHPYFERFDFVDEELPTRLKRIHARASEDIARLDEEDRKLLLSLPFKLIPERHRLGLIDAALQERLLEVRRWFAANLPEALRDEVNAFDPQSYQSQLSVFDNVVFGSIASSHPGAGETVRRLVVEVLDEHGLRAEIILLISDIETGAGGTPLPIRAREQIALARALIKRPDVLICNRAVASLPETERQALPSKLRELLPSTTLIWLDRRVDAPDAFDQVLTLEAGRIRTAGEAAMREPEGQPVSDAQQELNALAGVTSFSGLSPASLKLLKLAAQRREYARGEVLYSPGDPSAGAYIVVSGELEIVSADGLRMLDTVGPGDMTGEIAVLANHAHAALARASADTTALFVGADTLGELIDNDIHVATTLLRNVSARVARLVVSRQAA